MKRGFICFLVFGLASASYAADAALDSVGSETQEVGSKSAGTAIAFKYLDKNKRGAAKITNADSPSFNHLSSSNGAAGGVADYKTSAAAVAAQPPFRYVYNNQYYQANPYLTYVQIPQAAQIAAQYSFQANPVAHFLQTPTQIQYVATPTLAQVPQIKYQTFGSEYSAAGNAASDAGSSGAASALHATQPQQAQQTLTSSSSSVQYVPQSQHVYSSSYSSGQYVPQSQQVLSSAPQSHSSFSSATHSPVSSASSSSSSSSSQGKQVSVPLYSGYQSAQPVYYQQPYFFYPTANFVYQQPTSNYLLKQPQQQQQQQQIVNLYGGHRFGLYNPTQNAQLTYLVPSSLSPSVQASSGASSDLKSSGKPLTATQHSTSGNSFAYGAKA